MAYIVYGMGERIKEVRKIRGIKNSELAEKLELTDEFISEFQNDRTGISLETFVKLCEALDASADYLLFGKK